jgi:EAL and modified HD-GYP domain-containing signal transduction protein
VNVFIARQPILDATRTAVGYELLFRDGLVNAFAAANGTDATRQVMLNTFVLFGLQRLTGGRPAFVNITREALLSDLLTLFPPHSLVIEVLENVAPDPDVIAGCKRLKLAGYTIALDDVRSLEPYGPLLELADILKVDYRGTTPQGRQELAKRFAGTPVRLLAEKVESHEEFRQSVDQGFALFQGYFFARPETLRQGDVPGNRLQYTRLLKELQRPELSMQELETIIKQDIALSYRLLKYINSSLFGLRTEVNSVRHALTLMGERDIRRWSTLATLTALAPDKPAPLLETGLARARLCETLGPLLGGSVRESGDELFLLGLFSVLDAILDIAMPEALRDIAVPSRVKAALLGMPGQLRTLLDLAIGYEHGDWEGTSATMAHLGLVPEALNMAYVAAVEWAHQACAVGAGHVSSLPPARGLAARTGH